MLPAYVHILTEEHEARIVSDPSFRDSCIFLEPSDRFPTHFSVETFNPKIDSDMEIGRYSVTPIVGIDEFIEKAKALGYSTFFCEDPSKQFEWLSSLSGDPGVEIKSSFPNTFKGMLAFQIQGLNLTKNLRGSVGKWDTGCGKSILSTATTLWHLQENDVDLVLHVIKPQNLINMQNTLHKLGDLKSKIVKGTPERRQRIYSEVSKGDILILNYEKIRDDKEDFIELVEGKKVLFIFDEPHGKIQKRDTAMYRALCEVMYTSHTKNKDGEKFFYPELGKERASEMWCLATTATPIKKNPGNWFNIVRLIDPSIYGSVKEYNRMFVAGRDRWMEPNAWKNEELMFLMSSHIVHQVSKEDPEVAVLFPEGFSEDSIVDLHPKDARIYNFLVNEYRERLLNPESESIVDDTEILSAINCLYLLCASSESVLKSADMREDYERELERYLDDPRNRTRPQVKGSRVAMELVRKLGREAFEWDETEVRSAKMVDLIERVLAHKGQCVVFTRMNDLVLPIISALFREFDIEHVVFHGGMTANQKQQAFNHFRQTPSCKVFLSTDSGQDSIDLEMADLTIDFDEPQDYVGKVQRRNRISRPTSKHKVINHVTLLTEGTVEVRNREIWQEKREHHNNLSQPLSSQSSLSRSDLISILIGSPEDQS